MNDTQIAESILEEVDTDKNMEYDADWTEADEQRRQGWEAGEVFINRHIVSKINLFLDVYRKKGYSEDFIAGFIDGLSDAATGISFGNNEESVETENESVVE